MRAQPRRKQAARPVMLKTVGAKKSSRPGETRCGGFLKALVRHAAGGGALPCGIPLQTTIQLFAPHKKTRPQ